MMNIKFVIGCVILLNVLIFKVDVNIFFSDK